MVPKFERKKPKNNPTLNFHTKKIFSIKKNIPHLPSQKKNREEIYIQGITLFFFPPDRYFLKKEKKTHLITCLKK
jgi:hypothetical protein